MAISAPQSAESSRFLKFDWCWGEIIIRSFRYPSGEVYFVVDKEPLNIIMSDLNRGIMKFDGADKPVVVAVSAVLVLGAIAALIIWGITSAYNF